jgi:hypothetical protein
MNKCLYAPVGYDSDHRGGRFRIILTRRPLTPTLTSVNRIHEVRVEKDAFAKVVIHLLA